MISFDNRFSLHPAYLGLNVPASQRITLVSHAHTDHLPTRYRDNLIVCSDITREMMLLRKKVKQLQTFDHPAIEMLDAGHVMGSTMFLINKKVLYTGDFNTASLFCGKAEPVKCETLIMECTYGRPGYVFPDKQNVLNEMIEYVREHERVIILAIDSCFGKPQEICNALDKAKIKFSVNDKILEVNDRLGLKFKHYDPDAMVVITDSAGSALYPPSYKRVFLSGWCVERGYGANVDKGFVFSNHADYPSLIEFVKGCNPKKIYTHHGPAAAFAADLRKLGYNAAPLDILAQKPKKGIVQKTLAQYWL